MKFKDYIKDLRKSSNLSQEEASKKIGVSVSTIQNWERGDNSPDTNSIYYIAKTYNVTHKDIMSVLAQELDSEYFPSNNKISNKSKLINVLPDKKDLSILDGLEFNQLEQDLFLILRLSNELDSEPLPLLLNKASNCIEISLFLDKLRKYDLINKSGAVLTSKAEFIYNNIKKSNGELFNIYNIEIKDAVQLCNLYGLIDDLDIKLELINEIGSENNYYLNSFEKEINYYNKKEYYQERSINSKIKDYDRYNKRSMTQSRKDMIGKYLPNEYYEIIKEECSSDEYIKEKELYTKKMEFYEKHKELNEGLVEPEKPQELFYYKVIPTKKALDLLNIFS